MSRNIELEVAIAESDRVKNENERLKAQLDAKQKDKNSFSRPPSAASSIEDISALNAIFEHCPPEAGQGADESTDDFLDLVERISTRYRKVKIDNECYKTALFQLTVKYRDEVRKWKRWKKHFDSVEVQNDGKKPNIIKSGAPLTKEDAASQSSVSSGLLPEPTSDLGLPSHERQNLEQPSDEHHVPSSTQDTVEDAVPDQQLVAAELSFLPEDDDIPLVVSERSLKRKRVNHRENSHNGRGILNVEGSAKQPVRIKEESPEKSPPQKVSRHLRRVDTLDLEGLGSRIVTPRKHQRFKEILEQTERGTLQERALHELRQERSMSLPLDALAQSCQVLDPQSPINLTRDPDEALNDENAHQTTDVSLVPTVVTSANGRAPQNSHRLGNALNSLDPNVPTTPRNPPANLLRKGSSRLYERSAGAIPSVTEDGEEPPATRRHHRNGKEAARGVLRPVQRSNSDSIKEKHGRLQGLLDSSSPGRAPLSERKALHKDKQTSIRDVISSEMLSGSDIPDLEHKITKIKQEEDEVPLVEHKESAVQRQELDGRMEYRPSDHGIPPRNVQRSSAPLPPQQTPLRYLPTEALKLSDFKPNPKTNQGFDYAYKETVRNHDAKCRLPGCTDLNCCGGAFRRLAEIGALPIMESARGLWDSSSAEDEDPDMRLLIAYLGISANAVNRLSAEERQAGLVAAQAELFANQFGKHRQQWERARSPPGYWNTDFPSTQTQMKDRMEAWKREREKVEERAREARRGAGRWIFRDEAYDG